jgi:hypothetical protein
MSLIDLPGFTVTVDGDVTAAVPDREPEPVDT